MTTFWCPSDILITSCWLFTARWSTWPGKHLVTCVAKLVGSCIPIHAYRCLPDPKCILSVCSVAVPLCRPLLPCPSRWGSSLSWHGLWWLTCELHCSPLPLLWQSPLLSCAFWFSDQTSSLSPQCMSWVISRPCAPSSCKQLTSRDQDVRRTSKHCHWVTILQLCRVRSFYITDCANWINLFNTTSLVDTEVAGGGWRVWGTEDPVGVWG